MIENANAALSQQGFDMTKMNAEEVLMLANGGDSRSSAMQVPLLLLEYPLTYLPFFEQQRHAGVRGGGGGEQRLSCGSMTAL
jgi:hypothetical protein